MNSRDEWKYVKDNNFKNSWEKSYLRPQAKREERRERKRKNKKIGEANQVVFKQIWCCWLNVKLSLLYSKKKLKIAD